MCVYELEDASSIANFRRKVAQLSASIDRVLSDGLASVERPDDFLLPQCYVSVYVVGDGANH